MTQHILFVIALIIWFVLRIRCELIAQEMLSQLQQANQKVELKQGRLSLRLVQYIGMMSTYKTLLLNQGKSTRPIFLFWVTFGLMLMAGVLVLWLSLDIL